MDVVYSWILSQTESEQDPEREEKLVCHYGQRCINERQVVCIYEYRSIGYGREANRQL